MKTPPIGLPPRTGEENQKMRDELQRLSDQQSRLFAQLQAGEDHFKQPRKIGMARPENERRRLARELHDGIG
jgi:signal transduction histidine kinase